MRETAMSGRVGQGMELSVTSRDGFVNNSAILTPPQTPVSNPWKSASTNGVGQSLVSGLSKCYRLYKCFISTNVLHISWKNKIVGRATTYSSF